MKPSDCSRIICCILSNIIRATRMRGTIAAQLPQCAAAGNSRPLNRISVEKITASIPLSTMQRPRTLIERFEAIVSCYLDNRRHYISMQLPRFSFCYFFSLSSGPLHRSTEGNLGRKFTNDEECEWTNGETKLKHVFLMCYISAEFTAQLTAQKNSSIITTALALGVGSIAVGLGFIICEI